MRLNGSSTMRYHNVCIETFAAILPSVTVTSEELEGRLKPLYDRLRLAVGRFELMTGIKELRIWENGALPSRVSAMAGRKALDLAGFAAKEIDALLHCSVSRDFVEPATSTAVHRLLKLPAHALNFDVSNACLGMLSGMIMMANMIELGQIQTGIIVAGENSKPLMNTTIQKLNQDTTLSRREIKPWFASLTIGSAAAAVVMTHASRSRTGHRLLGGAHLCNTEFNHLCQGSADTGMANSACPIMQTDSEELLVQGVKVARDTWQEAKRELNWANGTPDVVCTHQVGRMHRQRLYDALDLDMAKDFATVEYLGNTGSAALPATVAVAQEEERISHGDNLALLGIGSGINCTMLGVEW